MALISRIDGGAFMRREGARFEITELESKSFRVRLGGAFGGSWLASLSTRLAERHVSIDHIHARLGSDEVWIAELHLLPLPQAPDLLNLDYVELAERSNEPPATEFELDTFRLIESRDYGGSLMLSLEALDSLGLLGGLLGALAKLGLFPLELHIETRGGHAYDSLWLATAGGAPPSTDRREAVQQLLEAARKVAP